MNTLTIAYITSRHNPMIEWFMDSLRIQTYRAAPLKIIIVDSRAAERYDFYSPGFENKITRVPPKPTIWQGEHRITNCDWWAKSNALNTGICLCETEWLAFCDDRSVLMPGYFECLSDAMNGNYAVCGNYEKRANMKVVDGVISDPGVTLGTDRRTQHPEPYRVRDWYGGHGALPLEWCLELNGFSEDLCDGLGSEDSMFGVTLHNSGYPICYDSRMKIIEDRTPGEIDGALKRADKGISPTDKSHKIVEILRDKTTSQNSFDIRNLRDRVLSGEPFPPPSASHLDWFDNELIAEMV